MPRPQPSNSNLEIFEIGVSVPFAGQWRINPKPHSDLIRPPNLDLDL
ncbi:MAG: hypothetical protein ACI83Y_000297 [Candidatus Azotimanducaceae bacterium]|jgi:hypothetical protein